MPDASSPDTADSGNDAGRRQHMRRGERSIAVLLLVSIASALALTAVYIDGGQPQLEGTFLFIALAGLGSALVVWAHRLLPDEQNEEPWPFASAEDDAARQEHEDQEAFAETIDRDEVLERRPFLRRLLVGTLGALGLAALFPIRSLGPRPGNALTTTAWRGGRRVVDQSGRIVEVDGVPVGGLVTVFPEGAVDAADAVAVVVRLPEREAKAVGAPEGLIAYSKLCTHAGCPVGLYLADQHTLLCPCHQSEFDVLREARPISGPAARRLPQLPIRINEARQLEATGDFSEPVGPAWWTR